MGNAVEKAPHIACTSNQSWSNLAQINRSLHIAWKPVNWYRTSQKNKTQTCRAFGKHCIDQTCIQFFSIITTEMECAVHSTNGSISAHRYPSFSCTRKEKQRTNPNIVLPSRDQTMNWRWVNRTYSSAQKLHFISNFVRVIGQGEWRDTPPSTHWDTNLQTSQCSILAVETNYEIIDNGN